MKRTFLIVAILLGVCFLSACSSAGARSQKADNLTVAKAQKEIKIGMSSSAVVEALGSPNIITTAEERRETWVYDKVSTQIDASSSSSGVWLVVAGASGSKKTYNSSQRTLTIIVKFDKEGKVRDFSYRTSSF